MFDGARIRSFLRRRATALRRWLIGLRNWLLRAHGGRTLVAELLSMQMLLTACAGVFAIAGLYWSAYGLLVENVDRWAQQWVDELQELGAPLYLDDAVDAFIEVERFTNRYPELVRVTYFDSAGEVVNAVQTSGTDAVAVGLDAAAVAELQRVAGTPEPHTLSRGERQGEFVIRGVLWTEQLSGDGLLGLGAAEVDTQRNTLGFMELQLDFAPYFAQLAANVRLASFVLVGILLALAIFSNRFLKRSLNSLSGLQVPIRKLAKGNLDVEFPQTPHREIATIIDTLRSTATSLRERDAHLTRLANHDALTGLFNRHRFVDELAAEIGRVEGAQEQSALLFIDLDQFKYVNDTCGHPAGDKLLVSAARLLEAAVRQADCIARFGGDEFAVLLRNVSRREVWQIASEILVRMRSFAHVEDGNVFQLQCSIGITLFRSAGRSADEVLAEADLACHEAKRRGRNRIEFYRVSAKETEQMKEDVGWTQLIKQALIDDMFVLRYQPIVHIATGVTTHHEVLLRLQLADGRVISPAAFLPAAERFGLMLDIDRWVIRHAIQSLGAQRRENDALKFTVNLSATAFEAPNLHARVRELLTEHGVPAEALIFEITEQVAIRSVADVERQLRGLRALGCQIAIDDFGTGYSSFSHLKRFRFDFLKVDGSFVENLARDPLDQTMVRLFAEIGSGLGVRTIAEFVTDATAYNLLARFGIDYAQGYHIGRPCAVPTTPSIAIPFETRHNRSRRARGSGLSEAAHVREAD